ncbi:MAG: sensor histidine kinase [Velocimicrobium sp.]
MIKKLQRKFIMITMGSLLLIMVLLVGSINAINFYQMDKRVHGAIKILSENQGTFPKYEKENLAKVLGGWNFQMNEETQFETRYFVVEVGEDGSIGEIDTGHVAAVTSANAEEYANKVISSNKKSGYEGIYKFAVVNTSFGRMLVFLDCRNQLRTFTELLFTSLGVAFITLLLMFILVSIFSKKAINPMIESMEKQKQFISDAGHEIKTPLAIISANADVLALTVGENEWITSIRNQTIRLDRLVKNLLTLSKMEEDSIQMVFTDFDLSETVLETADSFESVARSKNKVFHMNIQSGLKLHGDEGSIHQLVSTLLDNAMKYSDEGGSIKVSLSATKKRIKIEVYNTTPKMSKEKMQNLNQLFDRFYRADSSRSRETGGYGMGLSIAKSIVKAHHGTITAKSVDGFSIYFTVLIEL